MTSIIGISAASGAILFIVVAIEYSLVLRRNGYLFLPGFLFSAIWSVASWQTYLMDFLHAAIWSTCFLLKFRSNMGAAKLGIQMHLFWAIPLLAVFGAVISANATEAPGQLQTYFYIFCCVGTLLIAEQLVRNTHGLAKVVALSIGTFFLYNLYLYSYILISGSPTPALLQARALGHTTLGLILCSAPLVVVPTDTQRKKVELSRPFAFTTSSLIFASGVLLAVASMSYLVELVDGGISLIAQPFFMFLGVLLVGFNLASSTRRAKMRVFVDRHFFQAKYDYYEEWKKLSERLSPGKHRDDYAAIALQAILPIFHSKSGACFINNNGYSRNAYSTGMNADLRPIAIFEHQQFFDKMLTENWIYVPQAIEPEKAKYNNLIPPDLCANDNILFILPLSGDDKITGFLIVKNDQSTANLHSPFQTDDFNWEDFHLLNLVGKQVSNFVEYQMLMNDRMVTQQFDAYHQFTAFIMHDLKNLIAQQALVVQNASRFMHNPEFVEDAMETIAHSVKKMNRMVLKLNSKSAIDLDKGELERVSLAEVIDASLTRCGQKKPTPSIIEPMEDVFVAADFENLTMAFTHLLSNAQEATQHDGQIDITVTEYESEVECRITDSGEGMDQEFIDHRLFKPFDSTKKTLGMGIGAYQYQQILTSIGGRISVTSQPGEGSCFTVTLPIAAD